MERMGSKTMEKKETITQENQFAELAMSTIMVEVNDKEKSGSES